jgi:hypothetical protein
MGSESGNQKSSLLWLIWLGCIVGGILLLAGALNIRALTTLKVRLGAALLFSAIALIAGKDKPAGIISIAVVWIAVIITLFT